MMGVGLADGEFYGNYLITMSCDIRVLNKRQEEILL